MRRASSGEDSEWEKTSATKSIRLLTLDRDHVRIFSLVLVAASRASRATAAPTPVFMTGLAGTLSEKSRRVYGLSRHRADDCDHLPGRLCIAPVASCKFALTPPPRRRPRPPLPWSARLRSSTRQHVLQFGELAGAIAAGDLGIDRLRRRRHRLDQLQPLGRDRHHAAAQIGLRGPALDQIAAPRDRAGFATGSAPAERRRAPVP